MMLLRIYPKLFYIWKMLLKGKKVVITGAASGIGKALAEYLLAEYCTVFAVDINPLPYSNISNLITYQGDISTHEGVDALFVEALKSLGAIDIFIANAGFAYYEKLEIPDWQRIEKIYTVNVFSPIYSLKKLVAINGDKPCSFVAISSAMAYLGVPGYAQYAGTKGAVHRFMETYRNEHHHNLHLMVVYPIATKTNFFTNAGNAIPVAWPTQKPEAVAKAIIGGLLRKKKRVYPSVLFTLMLGFNRFFPFLFPMYLWLERNKFFQWHNRNK